MSFFAYKGFDKDLKCRGFQYEVGKTYSMPEKPVICERGFHCCKRLADVFKYYSPQHWWTVQNCEALLPIEAEQTGNRFCLVEVCGDVDIEEGVSFSRKVATNSITIVRELSTDEMTEIIERESEIAMSDWMLIESFAKDFRASKLQNSLERLLEL